LFASAILCVCSFCFIVLPISFAASIISLANFIDIVRPTLLRELVITHLKARLVARNELTSIGTGYVEPPILRAFTSTIGLAFLIAFSKIIKGSSFVLVFIISKAPLTISRAIVFLPDFNIL